MARVMKRGARLAVMTIVEGDVSAFKRLFECSGTSTPFDEKSLEAIHIFKVEELDKYLSQAGFKGFTYNIYGSFILFNAEKG